MAYTYKIGDRIKLVDDVQILYRHCIDSVPGTEGTIIEYDPPNGYVVSMVDGNQWLVDDRHVELVSKSIMHSTNNSDWSDWYSDIWD